MNPYICAECGEPCDVRFYNRSFGHAFGTEIVSAYLSDCCAAECRDKVKLTIVPEPELLDEIERRNDYERGE
jgi:hypothetical protein